MVSSQRAEGSLFIPSVLIRHLKELDYPEKSLNSMLRCGIDTGMKVIVECGCGVKIVNMVHHCCKSICPNCSKIRRRRILRKIIPYFKNLSNPKGAKKLLFLTISPQNYDNYEEGLKHIKQSLNKFLHRKYIKERIISGFYVIETKNINHSWNIHLHLVIYSHYLDNRLRGKCLDCGQNLIKNDFSSKKFYCANRFCTSTNVQVKENSKLVSMWKKSSSRDVHIWIDPIKSYRSALNYVTKYVSADKNVFSSLKDKAIYIKLTHQKQLFNTFGFPSDFHPKKEALICPICNKEILITFDLEITAIIKELELNPKPPNLNNYGKFKSRVSDCLLNFPSP